MFCRFGNWPTPARSAPWQPAQSEVLVKTVCPAATVLGTWTSGCFEASSTQVSTSAVRASTWLMVSGPPASMLQGGIGE